MQKKTILKIFFQKIFFKLMNNKIFGKSFLFFGLFVPCIDSLIVLFVAGKIPIFIFTCS